MSKLHTETTVPASTTQDTRQTEADRWKIDCERRREERETLLIFPSPKSLNYYWLLLFYFNIVHLLWTNNHKENLGLACAHNTFTGILVNVLLPVLSHMRHYT